MGEWEVGGQGGQLPTQFHWGWEKILQNEC